VPFSTFRPQPTHQKKRNSEHHRAASWPRRRRELLCSSLSSFAIHIPQSFRAAHRDAMTPEEYEEWLKDGRHVVLYDSTTHRFPTSWRIGHARSRLYCSKHTYITCPDQHQREQFIQF